MSLHPLPVDLQLADVLGALKNFQSDPGEGAHAAWHAAGFAIGLFHKHEQGYGATGVVVSPEMQAKIADIEATRPGVADDGFGAIDWNSFKPWAKKVLELLLMILE